MDQLTENAHVMTGQTERPRDLRRPRMSPAVKASGWNIMDVLFVAGMLALPFQVVQFGMAQPGHLWMLLAVVVMVFNGRLRPTAIEVIALGTFLAVAIGLTFLDSSLHIKAPEQILKYAFFYPSFYFLGRWFGGEYSKRKPPLGYAFLFALLAAEVVVQQLHIPYIFKEDKLFFANVLHGTFKERNWLADYMLLWSYFLFESRRGEARQANINIILFVAINAVTMALTGSKTAFVACGMIVLLRSHIHIIPKIFASALGIIIYLQFFASEFTSDALNERLSTERGLALRVTLDLLSHDPLGHGFGFVEGFFSHFYMPVLGLGLGVNSIFSVPLDLMLIAGPIGLVFWLVYFGGIGNGAFLVMLPLLCLSFLNPLHQSEEIYFFAGMLVSGAHFRRTAEQTVQKRRIGLQSLRHLMLAGGIR